MAKLVTNLLTQGLRGSTGNVTFVETRYGTIVKDRTMPRDPCTPAQQACRWRMQRAGFAWTALTLEQAAAWNTYALSLASQTPGSQEHPAPCGQSLFTRLAVKVLQIDESASIPVTPPASPFLGDGLGLTVESTPLGLRFTASAANAPGVVTEILVQALASIHRTAYAERYRSKGFVPFSGAGDTFELDLRQGAYAVAYRFVRAATGQQTAFAQLGTIVVP